MKPVNATANLVTVRQSKKQLPGDDADHSLWKGCCAPGSVSDFESIDSIALAKIA